LTGIATKKKRVFFVRHGNTFESFETPLIVGAGCDLSLTEYGSRQASAIGRWFLDNSVKIEKIFHGALKRQCETASVIGNSLGLPIEQIVLLEGFSEIHYGDWEGLSEQLITAKWPKEYIEWTKQGIWPEKIFKKSERDFRDSMLLALNDAISATSDNCLIVTSNGTLRYIFALCGGLTSCENPAIAKVATGAICETVFDANKLELVFWNKKP
jgi:broad specificity phosphatase PhoE